jgi:hypothetical protein
VEDDPGGEEGAPRRTSLMLFARRPSTGINVVLGPAERGHSSKNQPGCQITVTAVLSCSLFTFRST